MSVTNQTNSSSLANEQNVAGGNQTTTSRLGNLLNSPGAIGINLLGSVATVVTFAMDIVGKKEPPVAESASIGTLSVGTLSVSTMSIGTLQVGAVSSMPVATTTSEGEVTPPPSPTEEAGSTSNASGASNASGGIATRLALILPIISAIIVKMLLLRSTIGAVGETTEESLISKMFDWGKSAFINSKAVISGYLNSGIAGVKSAMTSMGGWIKTNKVMLGIIATIGFMIVAWDNLGVIGQVVCTALVIGLTLVKLASLGVTWPLLLIIGIVMAVAAVFLFWSDLAIKVCGLIMGGIFAVGAAFFNVIAMIINLVIKFCEIVYNMVAWLVWAWISLWYKFLVAFEGIMMAVAKIAETVGNTILKVMQAIANAIIGVVNVAINALNLIPGVDINTMSKVTFEPMDTVSNMEAFYASLESPGEFQYKDFDNVEKKSISDAFQKGQGIGESIGSSIVSWLEGIGRSDSGSAGSTVPPGMTPPEMQTPPGSMGGDFGMQTPPPGSGMSSGSMPTVPVNSTGGTIDEVGSIGSPVEMAEEDIKYMKDIAQTEYINQFTTLQPKLNATFGDVKETADVEKLMASIEQMMAEAYARSYVT